MRNHYHTLGVSEQATTDDIRRAYRRLVLLTHPDRTTDPAAHQQFLLVNEAYDVLSNPARRRGYDALLSAYRNPPRPASPAAPPPRATPPPRAAAPPRQSFRRRATPPIDFRKYQASSRFLGKVLLALALLVFVDYFGLSYPTTASFTGPALYDPGHDRYVVQTDKGRFLTRDESVETMFATNTRLRLRVSVLFHFIREARLLQGGRPLPVLFRHQALFTFTGLLLLMAGLTQGRLLGDAGRINAVIIATALASLVLLMLGK
ncbi:J domain-containing protein [Hymenobacter aquaticus]|uniref:J domain-containing protein n=1 Tax=Hymenobacter aquaticus TaxID=1867101 RepID=A0A4Z0PXU3_9BACT|nr:J domain-containing protein [Hymenobacter aquaticus]TGE21741.1 J domain-containing protein [Hymenobacter aquaticus]